MDSHFGFLDQLAENETVDMHADYDPCGMHQEAWEFLVQNFPEITPIDARAICADWRAQRRV